MRSFRLTRKAALIFTVLGLFALIVPTSASANHQLPHGVSFGGSAISASATCQAVQESVLITGADVNIVPPGVQSARVTSTSVSECAGPSTVTGTLTLNLFREVPPFSGSITLLASTGSVSCSAYPCTATLPTTTVARNANARFILQSAHTWNLPTGGVWNVAQPPFCWINSPPQAYCDAWADFFLP